MVFNFGGYKFKARNIASSGVEYSFGVSSNECINNYKAFFAANLGSVVINIEAMALPNNGDKNSLLKGLLALGKMRMALPLTNGRGEYFGRFVLLECSEKRASFLSDGAFLQQGFSLKMEKVSD